MKVLLLCALSLVFVAAPCQLDSKRWVLSHVGYTSRTPADIPVASEKVPLSDAPAIANELSEALKSIDYSEPRSTDSLIFRKLLGGHGFFSFKAVTRDSVQIVLWHVVESDQEMMICLRVRMTTNANLETLQEAVISIITEVNAEDSRNRERMSQNHATSDPSSSIAPSATITSSSPASLSTFQTPRSTSEIDRETHDQSAATASTSGYAESRPPQQEPLAVLSLDPLLDLFTDVKDTYLLGAEDFVSSDEEETLMRNFLLPEVVCTTSFVPNTYTSLVCGDQHEDSLNAQHEATTADTPQTSGNTAEDASGTDMEKGINPNTDGNFPEQDVPQSLQQQEDDPFSVLGNEELLEFFSQ